MLNKNKIKLSIIASVGIFMLFLTGFESINDAKESYGNEKAENVQQSATVTMTNQLKFSPDEVTIKVGETVLFKNTSMLVHTVTCDPDKAAIESSTELPSGAKVFNSGNLKRNEKFSHTFTVAGDYKYFCIPHEGAKMTGWIHVEK